MNLLHVATEGKYLRTDQKSTCIYLKERNMMKQRRLIWSVCLSEEFAAFCSRHLLNDLPVPIRVQHPLQSNKQTKKSGKNGQRECYEITERREASQASAVRRTERKPLFLEGFSCYGALKASPAEPEGSQPWAAHVPTTTLHGVPRPQKGRFESLKTRVVDWLHCLLWEDRSHRQSRAYGSPSLPSALNSSWLSGGPTRFI